MEEDGANLYLAGNFLIDADDVLMSNMTDNEILFIRGAGEGLFRHLIYHLFRAFLLFKGGLHFLLPAGTLPNLGVRYHNEVIRNSLSLHSTQG